MKFLCRVEPAPSSPEKHQRPGECTGRRKNKTRAQRNSALAASRGRIDPPLQPIDSRLWRSRPADSRRRSAPAARSFTLVLSRALLSPRFVGKFALSAKHVGFWRETRPRAGRNWRILRHARSFSPAAFVSASPGRIPCPACSLRLLRIDFDL